MSIGGNQFFIIGIPFTCGLQKRGLVLFADNDLSQEGRLWTVFAR